MRIIGRRIRLEYKEASWEEGLLWATENPKFLRTAGFCLMARHPSVVQLGLISGHMESLRPQRRKEERGKRILHVRKPRKGLVWLRQKEIPKPWLSDSVAGCRFTDEQNRFFRKE